MEWFRLYSEIIHDPKIRRLKPEQRWLWVAILCMANESPVRGKLMLSETVPMDITDIADQAGLDEGIVSATIGKLVDLEMISKENGVYEIVHWTKRQFESDSSTERVRKLREARKKQQKEDAERGQEQGQVHGQGQEQGQEELKRSDQGMDETLPQRFNGVSVTSPDTDTEADTDNLKPELEKEREGEGCGKPNSPTSSQPSLTLVTDATPMERAILHELKSVPGYPFDYVKDLEYVRTLLPDFPDLDILDEAKRWSVYKRDKPLAKKSNPRLQFRNWLEKAREFARERSARHGRGNPVGTSPPTAGKYDDLVIRDPVDLQVS